MQRSRLPSPLAMGHITDVCPLTGCARKAHHLCSIPPTNPWVSPWEYIRQIQIKRHSTRYHSSKMSRSWKIRKDWWTLTDRRRLRSHDNERHKGRDHLRTVPLPVLCQLGHTMPGSGTLSLTCGRTGAISPLALTKSARVGTYVFLSRLWNFLHGTGLSL